VYALQKLNNKWQPRSSKIREIGISMVQHIEENIQIWLAFIHPYNNTKNNINIHMISVKLEGFSTSHGKTKFLSSLAAIDRRFA
jgi:hypothetical protein